MTPLPNNRTQPFDLAGRVAVVSEAAEARADDIRREAMRQQGYAHARLDQRTMEILRGVR